MRAGAHRHRPEANPCPTSRAGWVELIEPDQNDAFASTQRGRARGAGGCLDGRIVMLKYFSVWQPLVDEDAHTALVFGFLRHAPATYALNPWLSQALDRAVTALPPEPVSFWPTYASVMEGHHRTEPELVFDAVDELGQLTIIIEAKPGFDQHTDAQVTREIIDAASNERAPRVALIMLGADRFEPPKVAAWRAALRNDLDAHGLSDLRVELRYSSWAKLGEAIIACGKQAPDWSRYADDATHQLRNKSLLGYDGGPMFDDLDGLTVPNAVEVYNRILTTAKNLFLTLESQERFRDLRLQPFGGTSRLTADGGIGQGGLKRPDGDFVTSMILSAWRKPDWPTGAGVYVAIWLTPDDGAHAELQTGAFRAPGRGVTDLVWTYAGVEEPEDQQAHDPGLVRTDKTVLDQVCEGAGTEWVYAAREWVAGQGDADLRWLLDRLDAAIVAWDPDPA